MENETTGATEAAPTPAGTAAWVDTVDAALVRRLHGRVRQPGVVRLGQARTLLARHRGMVPGVPLAEALTRRVPERAAGPSEVPVVSGRPLAAPAAAGWTAPHAGEPVPVVRTVVSAPAVVAAAPVGPVRAVPAPAVVAAAPVVPVRAVLTRDVPLPAVGAPAAVIPPAPARDLHTPPGTGAAATPAVTPAASPPAAVAPDVRHVPIVQPAPTAPDPLAGDRGPSPLGHTADPSRPDATRDPAATLSEQVRRPARPMVVPPVTQDPSLPVPPAPPRSADLRPAPDAAPPARARPTPGPLPDTPASPAAVRAVVPGATVADVPLARAAAPAAGPTDDPPVVTARRRRPRGVAPGEPDPGLPVVRPTPPVPPDPGPTPTATGRGSAVAPVIVQPGTREPGLAEQVHRLVVRELAGSIPPAASAPPLPLPVPAAPTPHIGGPQAARRLPAPVVRADRPAERPPRAAPPVDVGRVADAVSRRLARRDTVAAERRGMGR